MAVSNMILVICRSKVLLPVCYIFTLRYSENWFYVANQVGTKKSKLVSSDIKGGATESESVQTTNYERHTNVELHRFNSLLDPDLAVNDLDTIGVNPNFFPGP